jgi:hypothetical protein
MSALPTPATTESPAGVKKSQAIDSIIRATIEPMLKAPTLSEQLQAYIAELDKQNGRASFLPLPSSPILRVLFDGRHGDIMKYMQSYQGAVPSSLELDDDSSLIQELKAFRQFLRKHQYSTVEELEAAGIPRTIAAWFVAECPPDEACWTEQVQLWEASRKVSGLGDVSFSVWKEMSNDLVWRMVYDIRRYRVFSLTKEEKKAAVAEALSRKRKRAMREDEDEKE